MEMKRIPIKIRKPILLDSCTCYDQKPVCINGKPQVLNVPYDKALWLLNDVSGVLPLCLQGKPSMDELDCILDYKVPVHVDIEGDIEYGYELIEQLKKVSGSVLVFSIAPSRDLNLEKLRNLLFVAKNHKVMVTMNIRYTSGTKKIDMMDNIEQVRNFVSHVIIKGDVSQKVMADMERYLKERKITCECLGSMQVDNKVRLSASVNPSKPLGLKTFTYVKDVSVGTFIECEPDQQICCQKCEKPIF